MIFRTTKFCANYCMALIGTFLTLGAIEFFPGLETGYYSLFVIPLIVASMIEGKSFARQHRMRPRACQACLAAILMSVIAILAAKGAFVIVRGIAPDTASQLGFPTFESRWLACAAILGMAAVVLRIGFGFGLAVELRGQRAQGGFNDRMDGQLF